ncbi:MAG TPA: DUF2950 family protein, partial [Methylomirabilota bacterium]
MSLRILSASVVMIAMFEWTAASRVIAQTQAPPAPAKEPSASQPPAASQAPTSPAKPPVIPPKRFASPEEATEAFVAALRAHDARTLVTILGGEARPLISSGDPVADRTIRDEFVKKYDESHTLVAKGTDAMTLKIGSDEWPFAIPLVKHGDRWRFDVRQG